MTKLKTSEFVMDVRDPASIVKLNEWCYDNLDHNDFDASIITIFPLWYRYRFRCPKDMVMAALQA